MVVYDLWDVDEEVRLPHSYLYCREPRGVGTPFLESSTSYITRLAQMHNVPLRKLVVREIIPRLDRSYLLQEWSSNNVTAFWKDSSSLNGTSKLAGDWIGVLEALTQRKELRFTTMLNWAEALSPKGLMRRFRAWCPFCYEEQRASGQPVYDPLLWAFEVVVVCPIHNTPLQLHCPRTNHKRSSYMLMPRARLGYCSFCGHWLGEKFTAKAVDFSSSSEGERGWQRWVASAVGEMIALAAGVVIPPQKENFAKAVAFYVDDVADGNISAVARRLNVSRRTVRDWKKEKQVPKLASLLQFCYLCEVSPFQLLTENSPPVRATDVYLPLSMMCRGDDKKHYRSFRGEHLRQLLAAELQSSEYPPPSMSGVAKRLGYDHSYLYRYFPDLCRAVSARYREYRIVQCTERKQKLVEEVRQVTVAVHLLGVYPSHERVRNLLAKPGAIRFPEALNAWRSTLKELGLR